ncbi:unnamed protein product [Coregonus sp. 'balchen']|nr:unnamed protein product [Coregonus sp. 'balchen']
MKLLLSLLGDHVNKTKLPFMLRMYAYFVLKSDSSRLRLHRQPNSDIFFTNWSFEQSDQL